MSMRLAVSVALMALAWGGCRFAGQHDAPQQRTTASTAARSHDERHESAPVAHGVASDGSVRTGAFLTDAEAIQTVRTVPEVAALIESLGDAENRLRIEVTDRHGHLLTVSVTEALADGRSVTHGLYEVDAQTGEVIEVGL